MDVASGVFATVAIGIELIETIQKARKFLKGIRDAPQEISRLAQKVDQLYLTIENVNAVIEQQKTIIGLSYSVDLLENALQSCHSSVTELDQVVKDFRARLVRQQKTRRVWSAIAATVRKDDVERMQSRIQEAMSFLTTALVTNSARVAFVTKLLCNTFGAD